MVCCLLFTRPGVPIVGSNILKLIIPIHYTIVVLVLTTGLFVTPSHQVRRILGHLQK